MDGPPPDDSGLLGARMAITENNTTGRFLKHDYQLLTASEPELDSTLDAARALHADGVRLFIGNLPASALSTLSAEVGDSLLFNAPLMFLYLRLVLFND